jgi:ketosteroid isomerase-like protein
MAAMKKLAPALVLALAACGSAPPRPAMTDHTATLAAAEAAFAAHSVREDMRAAFLAAFAPDGMLVRNGWVVSNDWMRAQAAPPIVLDWRPQYVEVAASGDLGLSTGPWRITSKAKPQTPASHGQFVSVWRREGSGPWKVAVDLGISHAGDALWNAPLETRQLPAPRSAPPGGIAQAEARFVADAQSRGLRAAYAAHGAENLRFYRNGQAPATLRSAALASDSMAGAAPSWSIDRVETARAGDLGYARGAYFPAAAPSVPAGWYLRVWRREGADWRIVMDVVQPAPPPKQ